MEDRSQRDLDDSLIGKDQLFKKKPLELASESKEPRPRKVAIGQNECQRTKKTREPSMVQRVFCPYTGEIVARTPIKMVSTRNPPRKIAILAIRPPTS